MRASRRYHYDCYYSYYQYYYLLVERLEATRLRRRAALASSSSSAAAAALAAVMSRDVISGRDAIPLSPRRRQLRPPWLGVGLGLG